MGLIPFELNIERLYDTQDRRRKKSTGDKVIPPYIQSVCGRYLLPHEENTD
jgi:hypothetical protein